MKGLGDGGWVEVGGVDLKRKCFFFLEIVWRVLGGLEGEVIFRVVFVVRGWRMRNEDTDVNW